MASGSLKAGQRIRARDTDLNRNLGFNHETHANGGSGEIRLVKDDMLSFYFQRTTYSGSCEVVASNYDFLQNFRVVLDGSATPQLNHYTSRYPQDYQPKSN